MAGLQGAEVKFISFMGLSPLVSLGLAVLGEVVAMIALIIGFRSKLFAIPAAVTMALAAFDRHGAGSWFARNATENGSKEMAMLYLIPFIAIIFLGSGKYSVDYLIEKRCLV